MTAESVGGRGSAGGAGGPITGGQGAPPANGDLRRDVGLTGAVFMGLGSIVGTGLFLSLGVAAGVAGEGILVALPLAALLALFNGLSSAQLAAAHPVSGGTYAYARRFLSADLGFAAGTLFLLAKSASAATAALGFGGYLLAGLGIEASLFWRMALAGFGVLALTALSAGGIRRSNRTNLGIVGVTLVVLVALVGLGVWAILTGAEVGGWGMAPGDGLEVGVGLGFGAGGSGVGGLWSPGLLEATALLFVAYTGYGRIATLGEEVRDPARTIPRAIWITLGVVAALYFAVAWVGIRTLGAEGLARATIETAAPLEAVARIIGTPGLTTAVAIAAVTAMLGVLLNLILGLSRVAFAMGRDRELPVWLGHVDAREGSPRNAVLFVGGVVFLLVLLGDVRTTWSVSAFTVLLYYGITNLAALRLPPELRMYPRSVPLAGLLGCLLLAFHIPLGIWGGGVGVLVLAFIARALGRRPPPIEPTHP